MLQQQPFPLLDSFQLDRDMFSRPGLLVKVICFLAQCDLLQKMVLKEHTEPVILATIMKAIT